MNVSMEQIISLCKRRGFIYPGSEIYGGLAGTYDYGPLGVALKNNIKASWWKRFVDSRDDMYGLDAAIIMNADAWKASGHVAGFSDPMVECEKCRHRFRADHIMWNEDIENSREKLKDQNENFPPHTYWLCETPGCGMKNFNSMPKQFNMMFSTQIGAVEDSAATVYLRPETAQGIFVNFKNIVDSFHPKLPFGIGQIGKAFRNEITPRDFIFRVREFEQMEIEYFVRPETWETWFEHFRKEMHAWIEEIGLDIARVHELEVATEDLAHYSKRTIDFEFDYPFGRKELYGLAYRTNFDLTNHKLDYIDEETKEKIVPHVIEPSLGVDRSVLALLATAYTQEGEGEDARVYLKFRPRIAPVVACVSPLLKNKPELVTKAQEVYKNLKQKFGRIMFDDNGNVGKRYRRQDEIGTPWCIVIDFDTLGENPELLDTVTVRDRDTGTQERVAIAELEQYISSRLV